MPTRFVTFTNPIPGQLVQRTFMKLFERNIIPQNIPYTEDHILPGESRTFTVEGSSASYTVAIDEDGHGALQRVMAKPGARYDAFPSSTEGEGSVVTIGREYDQQTQEFRFDASTTLVIPIGVGSEVGDSIRAVFIHIPD